MVDEELRRKMGRALEEGKKDEALELSQKLDLQIIEDQKSQLKTNQIIKSNGGLSSENRSDK